MSKTPKLKKKIKATATKEKNSATPNQSKHLLSQIFIAMSMILLLLGSAVAVTHQVNSYRQDFAKSQQLRAERKQLDTEWHKLLLEQQTFGATTRISGRAVVSLGMYSPKPEEVINVNLPSKTTPNKTQTKP